MDELKQQFIAMLGQQRYDETLAFTNATEPEEDGSYTGWDTTGWTHLKDKESLLRFNLGTILELSSL